MRSYCELHARSAFAFLRAASTPEALAARAAELGLPALAVCDRDNVAGAARFYAAARPTGLKPILGAELTLTDGTVLPVLVESRLGYQNLCRLLTRAKLRSPKGEAAIGLHELPEFAAGLCALTGDEEGAVRRALARGDAPAAERAARALLDIFGPGRVYVEIQRHHLRRDAWTGARLVELARTLRLPLLATNGVCHALPEQRMALDVLTCARIHSHLDAAGRALAPNAERHLKNDAEMRALFADLPAAIEQSAILAERLTFTLEDLGYEFPRFAVPAGETMDSQLRALTLAGARNRYGTLAPNVLRQLDRELRLIGELGFAGYFLCVWDLVEFCRHGNILVQGRGSAANSAVCYSLGITAVDPIAGRLLFERFLSEGRKGWPDIDLDLPSGERRERVIQYVYEKYTRRGAAMTANVITFRGRLAAREIGKALHFPEDQLSRFSSLFGHGDYPHTMAFAEQMRQAGLTDSNPRVAAFLRCYQQIHGLPRHLGQHSGGMVICQHALDTVVPLENSSMPNRSIIQWDKDDCEDLGIVKVDLLGLGMMAVLQDTIELSAQLGRPVDLAQLPKDDPATYRMMQEADTIGVFQIESRAQMATLPRMKPTCFYDVAIEVAIIRPGPIEGGLMHPYLARREGLEPITYLDERLRPVLERTLGICLFQEQVLKVAMVMADFTPSEADELRRALGFKRSDERLQKVEARLRAAMSQKNATPECIDEVVKMTRSFALYGFPESHALSFGLLAYASTWLKCHRAPEFYASLLNNQPMGFYAPATLVQDARRHGIRVLPVCVQISAERCEVAATAVPEPVSVTYAALLHDESGAMRLQEAHPPQAAHPPIPPLSLTPGFSPVDRDAAPGSRFNGFPRAYTSAGEAVETADWPEARGTGLKPGVNERDGIAPIGSIAARSQATPATPVTSLSHLVTSSPRHPVTQSPSHPVIPTPLRLGLWQIQGLDRAHAAAIVAERHKRPFHSLEDLRRRVPELSRDELRQLARAGALNTLCGHRRAALWQVELPAPEDDLFSMAEKDQGSGIKDQGTAPSTAQRDGLHPSSLIPDPFPLSPMSPSERLAADYASQRLTTGRHPMHRLRAHLPGVWTAESMRDARDGQLVVIAGNVICRQRPGTAKGMVFVSLEDETGIANAIVPPPLFEKVRLVLVEEPYLRITGKVSRRKGPPMVQARRVERLLGPDAAELGAAGSHDFR